MGQVLVKERNSPIEQIVGRANEVNITVEGIDCLGLVDTGSQVTTISKKFCDRHLQGKQINPLGDLLNIEAAGGHQLLYEGYVELELKVPELPNISILALVVPVTPYNSKVPILIGTNCIDWLLRTHEETQESGLPHKKLDPAWIRAFKCVHLKQGDSLPSVLATKSHQLQPAQTTVIHGLCRNIGVKNGMMLVESDFNSALPSTVFVKPGIVNVKDTITSRVPLHVVNLGKKPVTIPEKTVLCHLHRVTVVTKTEGERESTELSFDVGEELTPTQVQQVKELIQKYPEVFSTGPMDLGHTTVVKHAIKLSDETPFKERHRRIPPGMYEELREHIQEMLACGAIRESASPWSSNIVLVRKSDGSLRVCQDFRKLNSRTIQDSYALPRFEEAMDTLAGSKWFTSLDLRHGYLQVEVEENDIPKTAFSVGSLGFYECPRMPFGLCGAPASFQRLMEKCLQGLTGTECSIFLDDILIFSSTFEEHLQRLEHVFQRLKEAGLKLKPNKCNFFQTKVKYLGHIISAEGISTDPDKISAVVDWPRPSTIQELQQFLGFSGYYRRFVKDYAKVVKPLNDLLKGGNTRDRGKFAKQKLVWEKEQEDAFQEVKQLLTTPPILGFADYKLPFIVHTDASLQGLGSILYQVQDGKPRVIAYASRGLSSSEKKYSVHKLEFLCLKWAVTEKFFDFLYGNNFEVRTDNNPLTYVLSTAKLDAAGHRWISELANLKFSISYRPGICNKDADGLSRKPQPEFPDETEYTEYIDMSAVDAVCNGCIVKPSFMTSMVIQQAMEQQDQLSITAVNKMDSAKWTAAQEQDPDIGPVIRAVRTNTPLPQKIFENSPGAKKLFREKDKLQFRSGVLYRKRVVDGKNYFQLVLPKQFHGFVFEELHNKQGHFGVERTLELMRERFFWPSMTSYVKEKIKTCTRCICRKASPDKASQVPIKTTQPMELVCLDYLTLEDSPGGYGNILVITDHFTHYAQAYPTTKQTARTTAKLLYDNFILHYGFPARIHSDQGRNFESSIIKQLCEVTGIKKSRTTPYHPQGNGTAEKFNHTLLRMLGTLTEEQKNNWKVYVPSLVHAYNCTKHTCTGYSPFYLLFGRQPRLPIDSYLGLETTDETDNAEYAQELKKRLQYAHEAAIKATDKARARYKGLHDRKAKASCLEIGDRVLVKRVAFKGKHKLADKWETEIYVVVAQPNSEIPVYTVKKESQKGTCRTLHRNLLFPVGFLPVEVKDKDRQKVVKGNKMATPTQELLETDSEMESEVEIVYNPSIKDFAALNPDAPVFKPSIISDKGLGEVSSTSDSQTNTLEISDIAPESTQMGSSTKPCASEAEREESKQENSFSDEEFQQLTPEQPQVRRSSRVRRPPERYNPAEWDMGKVAGNKQQLLQQIVTCLIKLAEDPSD